MKKTAVIIGAVLLLLTTLTPVFAQSAQDMARLEAEAKLKQKFEVKKEKLGQRQEKQLQHLEKRFEKKVIHRKKVMLRSHVVQGFVGEVDMTKSIIYFKNSERKNILVDSKTIINIVTDEGARVGTLADIKKDSRITAVVRMNGEVAGQLKGLVIVQFTEAPAPAPVAPGTVQ